MDFFSVNSCTVFDPQLGACGCGGPAVRTGVRHSYWAREHPRILVPTGGPGMIALQTTRHNTVFGESKVIGRLSIVRGVGNPTPALFKSQLYVTVKQTTPNVAAYNYHKHLSSYTSSLLHRPVQWAAYIFS